MSIRAKNDKPPRPRSHKFLSREKSKEEKEHATSDMEAPPVALSWQEQMAKKIRKAKQFVFLHQYRHMYDFVSSSLQAA